MYLMDSILTHNSWLCELKKSKRRDEEAAAAIPSPCFETKISLKCDLNVCKHYPLVLLGHSSRTCCEEEL